MKLLVCYYMISLLVVFASCKKDTEDGSTSVAKGTLNLVVSHQIDATSLQYDTLIYQNAAGNKYSISRLFYYISAVKLYKTDGTVITFDNVTYVDAKINQTQIQFSGVAEGDYHFVSFNIGIDSAHNQTGFLSETVENINMAWPVEMGGGYHFMKLEGHYLDAQQVQKGFTVHLGTNATLVNHNKLPIQLNITKDQMSTLNLEMNINEWFTNPYNYNFITDGNYTMGNVQLMQLISNNGKDVFHIR